MEEEIIAYDVLDDGSVHFYIIVEGRKVSDFIVPQEIMVKINRDIRKVEKGRNLKFTVGDIIWKNQDEATINRIFKIESDHYCLGNCADLPFSEQDEWELLEYHCTGIGKPRKATGVLAKLLKEMGIRYKNVLKLTE